MIFLTQPKEFKVLSSVGWICPSNTLNKSSSIVRKGLIKYGKINGITIVSRLSTQLEPAWFVRT